MNATAPSQLIAIVGGSGAGKGWLVARLCEILGDQACHLALDDFYLDRSHLSHARRARVNFDVPHAIDWAAAARVLRDCRAGEPTAVPRYDFATYSRSERAAPWQPRPIVLVEGLWLLRSPEVRRLFDLKIYLDAPPALRERRRLARDVAERGYSADEVLRRLAADVMPMHARYVEPQKRWADVVLPQPFGLAELDHLAGRMWRLLHDGGVLPPSQRETFRSKLLTRLAHHEYRN